jgi:hypothetical protein
MGNIVCCLLALATHHCFKLFQPLRENVHREPNRL